MDVIDKVALVTGGGRGIGRAIALVLARNGADVVVADLILENAQGVADEVVALERQSLASFVDVTDGESVDAMVREAVDRFGRIDILVNNAGVMGAPDWERRQTSEQEDWDATFGVNVRGVARVTDAVAPHMKERRYGKIVNIASIAGRMGGGGYHPYHVSKAGVISLTQGTAVDLAPYDINVNAVCPGLLWTPMWEKIAVRRSQSPGKVEGLSPRDVFQQSIQDRSTLKRDVDPEDVGHAVAFLASDKARNITGQALNVDAGIRMN